MTSLPTPSQEQQLILDDLFVFGKNVTVDAVAGTGKTTTILCALLYALKRDPHSKMAQLSYNKELVKSMRVGTKLRLVPEMPFSKCARNITLILQQTSQTDFARR